VFFDSHRSLLSGNSQVEKSKFSTVDSRLVSKYEAVKSALGPAKYSVTSSTGGSSSIGLSPCPQEAVSFKACRASNRPCNKFLFQVQLTNLTSALLDMTIDAPVEVDSTKGPATSPVKSQKVLRASVCYKKAALVGSIEK
jgi:hypothetical protein